MVGSEECSLQLILSEHIRSLPYKTLFPPGIQLYNPPSFLFARARFTRINKEVRSAVYQIREIPITAYLGRSPHKILGKMKLIRCIFCLVLNINLAVLNTSHKYELKNGKIVDN